MVARRAWWITTVLTAVVLGVSAAAAPADSEPLDASQLVYEGASIEFQLDVNGEAAMELLGGLLDATAEIAQQESAAMAKAGPVPPEVAAMAEPLIGPAKEAIKSITRTTVLVMKPAESVDTEQAMVYYERLMTSRGWTPMVTIRAEKEARILVLLAPGGKGVFGAVIPADDEMVVGMVVTSKPLGNLLAEIVRAGGGSALRGMVMAAQQSAAPVACEAEAEPLPAEEAPES